MRATLDHTQDESDSIRTFFFKPATPLDYIAGQFTELTLPHDNPDDRGIKRWFTLSSSPTAELVSITTRNFGDDASTFKRALFALEPGAEVDLAEAMGDFVLPKNTSTPLVFVAGGIGLTPFHSMFEWLADSSEHRNIRFILGVRTESDIIFQNTFSRAGIHATIVVSNPSEEWGGLRGRLDAETVLGIEKPSEDALIYLSGPEPMLEALENDLIKHGVHKRQLITDFFPGYSQI